MSNLPKDRDLLVLDIETSGLDPEEHEILSFAAFNVAKGFHYYFKIKPRHIETAHPRALEVNGYTEEDWADALEPEEALERINKLMKGKIYLGQNIPFDLGFIRAALEKYGIKSKLGRRHVDTMTLAYEHLVPIGIKSISLAAICDFLDITNDGAHQADADVFRTYEVYRKLHQCTWLDRLYWKYKNQWKEYRKASQEADVKPESKDPKPETPVVEETPAPVAESQDPAVEATNAESTPEEVKFDE
jgi:DNA polymerase III epsilon subunit-like protein